jgi:DNA-binding LacI/PurR family transcriptional regulator
MPSSSDRASLATVARALGLSTATISNVYNRPQKVSDAVQQRVLAYAEQVGYLGPDPVARQLRRGRSEAIGLVFTDEMSFAFRDPACVAFLQGLAQACQEANYNLLCMPAGPPRDDGRVVSVGSAAIDALTVYSVPDEDPHLRAVLRRGVPVVVVDQPGPVPGADWVGLDDRSAARELGRHLAELGHRRIGVITSRLGSARYNGPVDEQRWRSAQYAVTRERIHGLREGLFTDVVPGGAITVEERFETSPASGASALHALLDREPDLTVICCLADVLAIGTLEAAKQRQLNVPGDLSITGFDDIAEASRAQLTTVHQPLTDKGRIAGELLLRRIARPTRAASDKDIARTLPTSLEIRRTTAVAAR